MARVGTYIFKKLNGFKQTVVVHKSKRTKTFEYVLNRVDRNHFGSSLANPTPHFLFDRHRHVRLVFRFRHRQCNARYTTCSAASVDEEQTT